MSGFAVYPSCNDIFEYNDDFEGSHHERQIFQEVFFGEGSVGTIKKSFFAGVNDFEVKDCKLVDTSPCSNSDNSAITSQSSSKSLLVDESDMKENSGAATASGHFSERFSLVEGVDHNKRIKRTKISAAESSNTELGPIKVLTASVFPQENLPMPSANIHAVCDTVKLYLVEQFCEGFASSCCLLKDRAKPDISGAAMLPNSEANIGKEMVVGKVIASPVSQESYANKLLLAASPPLAAMESGPLNVKEKTMEFHPGLDFNNLIADFKKDPRPFLQSHCNRLLLAAGWHIERRKRPSRNYMESVYHSPEQKRKSFREFTKVWRFCGQLLNVNRYDLVQTGAYKEWADICQFWSDLNNAFLSIEKLVGRSDIPPDLALQWIILDPFVNVVLINRKVGLLRKGDVVKAVRSLDVDKNEEKDAAAFLNNEHNVENQSFQRNSLAWHDSSVANESELAICKKNEGACGQQLGTHTNGIALDLGVADSGEVSLVDSASGMGYLSCQMLKDKVMCLDMTSSPSCGMDYSCAQSYSCQCNSPVIAENANVHGNTESVSPHQDSSLNRVDGTNRSLIRDDPMTTPSVTPGAPRQSSFCGKDGVQCNHASRFKMKDSDDTVLKKKMRRKSKKISEIRSVTCNESNDFQVHGGHSDTNEVVNNMVSRKTKSCTKSSPSGSLLHQVVKRGSVFKMSGGDANNPKIGKKKPSRCQIKDDDLLVSAFIKNKDFGPDSKKSASKKKVRKSRAQKKFKNRKGGCKLLPRNLGKAGKHYIDGKWSTVGAKSVLSWLINMGIIHLNDVIQYRNSKDDVIKDGLITRDGIMCRCCHVVLSVSEFKNHAGYNHCRPCLNLFMESGKPFTLCQLQAWSTEYKARKSRTQVVRTDEDDDNDDSCGLCGDCGELICCDNCPATFHQACLSAEVLPEGNWYCSNCTCWTCGALVNDNRTSTSLDGYKCSQCEHKFHGACNKGISVCSGVVSDTWFCGGSCQEVYCGLHSRVGISSDIADGFSWTLLKCMDEEQKVHSSQRLALKAECNSKLAVALTIMEECFQSMVDSRTGIDMIPQVLYNWGSEFARLNFQGFYTVVLEREDTLVSAASIRVHGITVAEMPLVATSSNYRRQGMCRRLLTAIEEMLISFKVRKLVISAIPELVETWTKGFGFIPVSCEEKHSLNNINLMVFPGTVLLKKSLYEEKEPAIKPDVATSDDIGNNTVGEHIESVQQQLEGQCCADEDGDEIEKHNPQEFEVGERKKIESVGPDREPPNSLDISINQNSVVTSVEPTDGKHCSDNDVCNPVNADLAVGESQDRNLQEQFSKMSCGESVSEVEKNQAEVPSNIQSVNDEPCLDRQLQLVCELNE